MLPVMLIIFAIMDDDNILYYTILIKTDFSMMCARTLFTLKIASWNTTKETMVKQMANPLLFSSPSSSFFSSFQFSPRSLAPILLLFLRPNEQEQIHFRSPILFPPPPCRSKKKRHIRESSWRATQATHHRVRETAANNRTQWRLYSAISC